MKQFSWYLAGAMTLAAASLQAPPVDAQTIVRQIDEQTLQVIDYSWKPPYKRRYIAVEQGEAAGFARFEAGREQPGQTALAGRAGSPGKTIPGQRLRRQGEVAEFARFEETDQERAVPARLWRGAPGKAHR